MLVTAYINLCRLRHARSMRNLLALQRCIYGQHVYRLPSRPYVQTPEARSISEASSQPGQDGRQQNQPPTPSDSVQQTKHHQLLQPSQFSQKELFPKMSSGVDIPFCIDWIFPRLRYPSKLWYFMSQVVIAIVGIFSKIVMVCMNKTHVYNRDRLVNLVSNRPRGTPLITVCNHHSCFDDPGLWGVLPVSQVCNTFRIRWSMAAHDICFTNKPHSLFFMLGKCIPVVRGIGVHQEAINLCIEKCALGHWVHVFPEGKVNMTKEEMRLKWGVGRIIYESPVMPIVLPMWHEGMDEVLPNVEPYSFQWRKKVTLNIGEPMDLSNFINTLKEQETPEHTARKLITDKIQTVFQELREETIRLHRQN